MTFFLLICSDSLKRQSRGRKAERGEGDRQTHRQTGREMESEIDSQTDRQTDRQTGRQRQRKIKKIGIQRENRIKEKRHIARNTNIADRDRETLIDSNPKRE